jgi:hypothetical protein
MLSATENENGTVEISKALCNKKRNFCATENLQITWKGNKEINRKRKNKIKGKQILTVSYEMTLLYDIPCMI